MDRLPGQGRMRNRTPELREVARQLRKDMTPAEKILWETLRRGALDGLSFRRQHTVGTFVFDFYCPSRKLVVEVDGGIHDVPDNAEHDRLRDAATEAFGYRVLRVRNEAILGDLPGVLDQIRRAAG